MPRFYFDSRVGDKLNVDEVGVDAPDLVSAKRMAMVAITEMGRDEIPADGDHEQLAIQVRSEAGGLVLTLSLRFDLKREGTPDEA